MSEDPFAVLERMIQQQPKQGRPKKAKEAVQQRTSSKPQRTGRHHNECPSCGGTDHIHGRGCQCKLCLPTHIPLTAEERLSKDLSILR